MKNIIDVEVKTQKVDFGRCKTEMLSVGIFSDAKGLDKLCADLDRRLTGAISRLINLGDFKGKEGTSAIVYGDGRLGAERLLLVGLGEKKKATVDTVRKAAANTAKKAVQMQLKTVSLCCTGRLEDVLNRLRWVGRVPRGYTSAAIAMMSSSQTATTADWIR